VSAELHAFVGWDQVEMQVEDCLTGRRFVVLHQPHAIGLHPVLYRTGKAREGRRHFGEHRRIGIEQIARRRLGDHQRMAARLGKDVHHDEQGVVLEHFDARDLATQHFGEDVAVVVARHGATPIRSNAPFRGGGAR
jgi:hypothetical protein